MALDLLHEAAQPYLGWLLGGEGAARAALDRWTARPSSEVAAERIVALTRGRDLVGTYIAMPGSEVASCRAADVLVLLAEADSRERPLIAKRIARSRELFVPVPDFCFYLSRVAVAVPLRGRGLGREVLDHYIAAGRATRARPFCLDVAADNVAAIALYRSARFEVEAARRAAGMEYLRMTLVDGRRTSAED